MKKTIKKLTSFFLTVVMVVSCVMTATTTVYAYEYTNEGVIYTSSQLYLNTYTVTGSATNISGHVSLLSSTAGCPVIGIEPYAFWCRTGMTSISIPDSITSIGSQAFGSCTGLSSVELPAYLSSIESEAFWGCTGLVSISIPESVTQIGADALYGCTSLETVYFGGSRGQWEAIAISSGNDALNSATIVYSESPESDSELETAVLSYIELNITSAKKEYEVGEQLDISGLVVMAVYEDNSTKKITEGYTATGFNSNQTGSQLICITYKGKTAYYEITVIQPVVITPGIAIKTLPNKTEYAPGEELDITGLSLTLTKSDGSTQAILEGFTVGTFDSTYVGKKTVTVSYAGYETSFTVTVKSGEGNDNICGDNLTWTLDEEGVLTITGTGAMTNWSGWKELPWADHLSTIKSVIIQNGVTSIGNYAFYCCDMTSITIPSSIKSIGIRALASCCDLTSIVIPAGVETVGNLAFESCDNLVEITIPESVTTIGHCIFEFCPKLNSINVSEENTTYSSTDGILFNKDKSIIIWYPAGKENTSYIIPQGVTKINNYAFSDSTNLSSISIPDGTITIDYGAFNNCENLKSIIIPKTIENIGYYAFWRCTNLEDLYYQGTKDTWDTIIIDDTDDANASLIDATIHFVYTITYDANGGTGAPTTSINECNKEITLSEIVPTRENHEFLGWSTSPTGNVEYIPGEEYSANTSIVLYAVWQLDAMLQFSGAALTLHNNIAVNYKVDSNLIVTAGYSNPHVVFEFNGEKTTVDSYSIVGDRYVFSFNDIAPNQMNDTIYATLYATYDGVEYASETKEYSVAAYCYNMLEKCSGDEYAEFRTLLVDLLQYGAASQNYTDYNTDSLVDAKLTSTQLTWGTSTDRTLETVLNPTFQTIETPKVEWKGAGLNLQDSVTMRLKFTAESIQGLTLKIESAAGTCTITSDNFVATTGGYYAFFSGLNAAQMSETVYLTFYEGDTPVSNTARYSIESYAYSNQASDDVALANLVKAMMRYGDSAYAYVN